jgi:hypothetical protein
VLLVNLTSVCLTLACLDALGVGSWMLENLGEKTPQKKFSTKWCSPIDKLMRGGVLPLHEIAQKTKGCKLTKLGKGVKWDIGGKESAGENRRSRDCLRG